MLGFGRSLIARPTGRQGGGWRLHPLPHPGPPSQGLDPNLLFSQGSRAPSVGAGGLVGRKLRGESGQQVSTCAAGFWVAASSLTGQVHWGFRLSVGAWGAASKQRLGPSDCSKYWFGVIRRHIIRRRQARGSECL